MIKNIMIGAVTDSKATISGKNPYTIGLGQSKLAVYILTFDRSNLKVYLNGELINTVANAGNTKYMGDIYLGEDYDDGAWFKGLLPHLSFYNKALGDTERNSLTNWLADRWLTTGTVLGNGHTTLETAGTKPTWATNLGRPFMDFDAEGLTINTGRVTQWTDSTSFGGLRVATPRVGTTLGIQTVKNKNALYFDNATRLTIPIQDDADNSPDSITVALVVKFDNFDSSDYSGSGNQTVLDAGNGAAIRIKNYAGEGNLSTRFGTGTSGYSTIETPKEKFVSRSISGGSANIKVELSKTETFASVVSSTVATSAPLTNEGTTLHNFLALDSDTKYFGRFVVDNVPEVGNLLSFKTLSSTNKSFKIITGSCNRTGSTAVTWSKMLEENADLLIHLGDLHYENIGTSDPQDYTAATDLALASPEMSNFFRNQAMVYIYDNHDSVGINPNKNSDYSKYLPYYDRTFPHYPFGSQTPLVDSQYFSWVMGRTRLILTNNRTHRDAIQTTAGPNKTNLGTVQKAWLKSEFLAARDAGQAVIWFSGICYIADGDNPLGDSFLSPGMSWGNYVDERREIANYIYSNQVKNVTIVSGDSHLQSMDDGRNSIYATNQAGERLTRNEITEEYLIPNLAASPFDQYVDLEGGPWQINDAESSGKFQSREQSYGVIEVIDKEENWIQFKFRMEAYNPSSAEWESKEYVYNRVMDGPEGLPPIKYTNIVNQNGYVAKDSVLKPIASRKIGVGNQWKDITKKYVGVDGFWKIVYNRDEVDFDSVFYVKSLQAYTANPENSIEISGGKFLDSQFVFPKVGGHFELQKNYSDVFENLASGTLVGTNASFGLVNDVKCLTMNGSDSYFQLSDNGDSGFDSITLVGTDGSNDVVFSEWIYIQSLGVKRFIFSYGDATNYGAMYVDVDNKVYLEFSLNGTISRYGSTETISVGWNKFILNRKGSSTDYTFIYLNGVKLTINFTGMVVPGVPLAQRSAVRIGAGYDAGVFKVATGSSVANVFVKYKGYATPSAIEVLTNKPTPVIMMKAKLPPYTEYQMSALSVGRITNESIGFTVPPTDILPLGEYYLYVKSIVNESSKYLVRIEAPKVATVPFVDNFSNPSTLRDNYFTLNKAWGGANGGVIKENVFLRNGELILRGNGDRYTGNLQGRDRVGAKKFHTIQGDPEIGLPWKNRVGGCIVYNKRTGFGSYEVDTFIPNKLGCAYAIWTFFYNEIYPSDPKYQSFKDEGLHEQGSVADGYYITRNHEIDIEFPSQLDGGDIANPSLSNMKCNTWRGELQNWDVNTGDAKYWEEYRDNLTEVGFNIADGNYHKLRYDWYPDRVEFFVDGVLKRTNRNEGNSVSIPDIPGFFTFGIWFPSSPLPAKPWLVNPTRAWGGGVVDTDGGMKADFDTAEMRVREFKFTPFSEYKHLQREVGETFPFGGYGRK